MNKNWRCKIGLHDWENISITDEAKNLENQCKWEDGRYIHYGDYERTLKIYYERVCMNCNKVVRDKSELIMKVFSDECRERRRKAREIANGSK